MHSVLAFSLSTFSFAAADKVHNPQVAQLKHRWNVMLGRQDGDVVRARPRLSAHPPTRATGSVARTDKCDRLLAHGTDRPWVACPSHSLHCPAHLQPRVCTAPARHLLLKSFTVLENTAFTLPVHSLQCVCTYYVYTRFVFIHAFIYPVALSGMFLHWVLMYVFSQNYWHHFFTRPAFVAFFFSFLLLQR